MATAVKPEKPVSEYARLLLKMHELDPFGRNESRELDDLCERLDAPWSRMSGAERIRVKGLSQDLYTLADGRRGVPMAPEQRQLWREKEKSAIQSRNPDLILAHLREASPDDVQFDQVMFVQGECWKALGELDVTLVFMQEAAKTLAAARVAVVDVLRELNRYPEAIVLAEQLFAELKDSPWEAFVLARELCLLAEETSPVEAKRIYGSVVPALELLIGQLRINAARIQDGEDLMEKATQVLEFAREKLGRATSAWNNASPKPANSTTVMPRRSIEKQSRLAVSEPELVMRTFGTE